MTFAGHLIASPFLVCLLQSSQAVVLSSPQANVIICENVNASTSLKYQVTVTRTVPALRRCWMTPWAVTTCHMVWQMSWGPCLLHFRPRMTGTWCHLCNTQHQWLNCIQAFKCSYCECAILTGSLKSPQSQRTWISQVHPPKYSSPVLCSLCWFWLLVPRTGSKLIRVFLVQLPNDYPFSICG